MSELLDAIRSGDLDKVRLLHDAGCPWDSSACHVAAANGHVDVLRWLHEKGCPWNASACEAAALNGHLDVLRLLHDAGCPWDASACHVAATNGHLDVLRWLLIEGAPCDSVRVWALSRHCSEVGKYRDALDRRVLTVLLALRRAYRGIKPLYLMYILMRMRYAYIGDELY